MFISAAQKQMTALVDGGYVDSAVKKDILENKVVLIVPVDSTADITSFEDCATDKVSLIALGNSDVPVGQYSEKLFTAMGIWEDVSAKATLGTNVKEVLSYVSEAAVDCGVVYYTDYVTAKDTVKVVAEAPEGKIDAAIYPAAVLKDAANAAAAEEFLTYLQSDAGDTVFTENGFTVID